MTRFPSIISTIATIAMTAVCLKCCLYLPSSDHAFSLVEIERLPDFTDLRAAIHQHPNFSRLRVHLDPDKLRPYLPGWSPASSSKAGRAYLGEGGYRGERTYIYHAIFRASLSAPRSYCEVPGTELHPRRSPGAGVYSSSNDRWSTNPGRPTHAGPVSYPNYSSSPFRTFDDLRDGTKTADIGGRQQLLA